ncbi:hypothetical protein AVEN_235150-1 [Araneus ventricosus]|uniref:Uncharacterized protein n=1 Tax=Araneus ventricosus TaxID=182803 RepID=A0A4Y2VVZ8_ARAVE|nr:hypothetical protein AVEN_4902-1 [Araneus ventricosus]GBO28902.1 hypothetical protein AVEN_235150-1 [Araneus ventricosus]
MPSLASQQHTRKAASVTNFTVRSAATVWHGKTMKDRSGTVLSGSESLSMSSPFDTFLRPGGTVIDTSDYTDMIPVESYLCNPPLQSSAVE